MSAQTTTLSIGSKVADFTLNDQNGQSQTLSKIVDKGPVALVVFRSAGWCKPSQNQLADLQQSSASFHDSGLQIVSLSFDSQLVLNNFATREGISFPLLADPKSKVIAQLGLVNKTYKTGTLRHGLARAAIVLIDGNRNVINILRGDADQLVSADQLLAAWTARQAKMPQKKKQMSMISVSGNKFVDDRGKQVLFKGLSIADPHKIKNDGHWNKAHFQAVKQWGADLVRIPVHPANLRARGSEAYLNMLQQAVAWCEELEMYVIIDWHSIGNLKSAEFEADVYITNVKETLAFWDLISKTFAGNPTVAFYEIFNEPTLNNGEYGECTWLQWKLMVERIIDVIHRNDKKVVKLVGGFNWAYDLRSVADHPIARENVAYVVHPYPGKCQPPREGHWEEHFGYLTDRFPVIASEMGFYLNGHFDYLVDDGSFRDAILPYLDKKQISWCAWIFDPDWNPALIESYDYKPTASGKFFKDAMLKK